MGRWTGDDSEGATTGDDTPDGPAYTSLDDREHLGVTSEQIMAWQNWLEGQEQQAQEAGVGDDDQPPTQQPPPPSGPDMETVAVGAVAVLAVVLVLRGGGQ